MQGGLRALILRNLTAQSVGEGVALACGLVSTLILSQYLGVAGFGAFNYVFAFMYLFLSLNDLGVNTIVVREISQAPGRAGDIIGAALSLRLAIAGIVFVAACAAIALWPMDPSLRAPLLLFALILPVNALNVPGLVMQTAMRFDWVATTLIIWRVSGLALIVAVLAAGYGVMAVLAALLVSDVIGTALLFMFARRLVRFRVRVDRAEWRLLMQSALPVGATLLLTAIVNRVDFLMLERMTSIEAVGQYGAAYRVTNLFERLPLFVMATLYPVMSRLAAEDPRRLREVYRKSVAHLAAIGLPLGIVVSMFAPWMMALVFGEQYRMAGNALRYLIWSTTFLYLALTGGNLLISVGRSRDNFVALALGAAVNIGLNLVLIPARGVEGAAIATAISVALVLMVTMIAVERLFHRAGAAAQ